MAITISASKHKRTATSIEKSGGSLNNASTDNKMTTSTMDNLSKSKELVKKTKSLMDLKAQQEVNNSIRKVVETILTRNKNSDKM